MNDEDLARALGTTRLALGALALLAPQLTTKLWLGREAQADSLGARMAMRGLGGRDVAIGLGLLIALERGGPVRGWLEAGALADASDTLSTLVSTREIPRLRWFGSLLSTAGASWLGLRLASALGD